MHQIQVLIWGTFDQQARVWHVMQHLSDRLEGRLPMVLPLVIVQTMPCMKAEQKYYELKWMGVFKKIPLRVR